MTLTASLSSTKPEESIIDVLHEWLTSTGCFLAYNSDDRMADVRFDPKTLATGSLPFPEVFVEIIDGVHLETGAGRLNSNAQRMSKSAIIQIRVDRNDDFLKLTQLGDRLYNYWRTKATGAPVLGAAGLKRSKLYGPWKVHNDKYYIYEYRLDFIVLVSG